MRSWSISEARARIADVADAALSEGPQRIERRDREPVIVVAASTWDKLTKEYSSFADIVLGAPIEEEDLPTRQPARVSKAGFG